MMAECRRMKAECRRMKADEGRGWTPDKPKACQRLSTFNEKTHILCRRACFYDISLEDHDCVEHLTKHIQNLWFS